MDMNDQNDQKTVTVNGKILSQADFHSLQENLSQDKSKKLKKVSEDHYKVLDKLQG